MPEDFVRLTTSYRCPFCGRQSANPHDIANRYCGACHAFPDDVIAALEAGLAASTRMGVRRAIDLAIAAVRTSDRAFNEKT